MVATDRRSRARAAIQKVALKHGLPTDLTILSERWNTVARLGESGVIARAATLADIAREYPLHSFKQEVDVCTALSSRGAPVQVPIGDVAVEDGFPISLWREVNGEMGVASEKAMVQSLAEIHSIGSNLHLNEPWFAPVAESIPNDLTRLTEQGALGAAEATTLYDHFARSLDEVVAADLAGGLIHGDAQRKNAMAVGDKAIWIDFEDCCVGPYAWDLACLTMNPNYDINRVLNAYAEFSGSNRISGEVFPHLWALRDLEALTWMLLIQSERDQVFRDDAASMLIEVLEAATGG